jgi:hypothetical protein
MPDPLQFDGPQKVASNISIRFKSTVPVCGLAAGLCYTALAFVSHTWSRPPLWIFFCCMAGAAAAMIAVFCSLASSREFHAYRTVMLWAALFRIIGFFGHPLYEDDYFRYLWDGREFVTTGNPYLHAPAEFSPDLLPPPFPEILKNVEYPFIPTIYGPVCQYAFAAAYLMAPGRVWALKLIFTAADLLLCLVLIRLGVSPGRLALYAWSPLVIKEIAFTAHTDSLAALFSLGSVYLAQRNRTVASGFTLALAAGAKIPSLLIAPAVVARGRLRSLYGLCAGLILLYSPFWRQATDFAGLSAFLQNWEFNSFGFAVLKHVFHLPGAKIAGFGIVAAVLLLLWRNHWNAQPRDFPGNVVWGVFCLFSPVVNPWYLVAWVPWTALSPDRWAIAACLIVLLSYATGNNLPSSGLIGYNHPWWVRPAEVLPVLLCAGFAIVRDREARSAGDPQPGDSQA